MDNIEQDKLRMVTAVKFTRSNVFYDVIKDDGVLEKEVSSELVKAEA